MTGGRIAQSMKALASGLPAQKLGFSSFLSQLLMHQHASLWVGFQSQDLSVLPACVERLERRSASSQKSLLLEGLSKDFSWGGKKRP
jgi:hypothetical protein